MDHQREDHIVLEGAEVAVVTAYQEADEILRRRDDFMARGGRGANAYDFVHNTVIDLDGQEHTERRRLLGRLVSPDQLRLYESSVLDDALSRYLDVYLAAEPEDDGAIRFNLVELARNTFWHLAARMTGLDGVDAPQQVDLLERTVMPTIEGTQSLFTTKDPDVVHERGVEAKERFRDLFFRPSAARRRDLLAGVDAGEIAESEVPVDVISLMLRAHPDDEDLLVRECILFLGATVSNTVASTAHSLAELEAWVRDHPEDEPRMLDDDFLEAVVRETIRIHRTGNPYLIRESKHDVALRSSGRRIPAGTRIAMDLRRVGKDPAVFGADAATFNPHRTVVAPRVKDYGLALGMGPHVCLGKPMVVDDGGGKGILRLQGRMLKRLVQSGIRVDPSREPVREQHGAERYSVFPVVLTPAVAAD